MDPGLQGVDHHVGHRKGAYPKPGPGLTTPASPTHCTGWTGQSQGSLNGMGGSTSLSDNSSNCSSPALGPGAVFPKSRSTSSSSSSGSGIGIGAASTSHCSTSSSSSSGSGIGIGAASTSHYNPLGLNLSSRTNSESNNSIDSLAYPTSQAPMVLPRSSSTNTHRTAGTRPWKGGHKTRSSAKMVSGIPIQSRMHPRDSEPGRSEAYERAMELRRKKRAQRQEDRVQRRLDLLSTSATSRSAQAGVASLCLSPRGATFQRHEKEVPALANHRTAGNDRGPSASPSWVCPWCASLLCVCSSGAPGAANAGNVDVEWVFPEPPRSLRDPEVSFTSQRSFWSTGAVQVEFSERERVRRAWSMGRERAEGVGGGGRRGTRGRGEEGSEGVSVSVCMDSAGQLAEWRAKSEKEADRATAAQIDTQQSMFLNTTCGSVVDDRSRAREKLLKEAAHLRDVAEGTEERKGRAEEAAREASASAVGAAASQAAARSAAQAAQRAAATAVAAAVLAAEAAVAALTEASEQLPVPRQQAQEEEGGRRVGRSASAKVPRQQAPFRGGFQVKRSPSSGSCEGKSWHERHGKSSSTRVLARDSDQSEMEKAMESDSAPRQGSRSLKRSTTSSEAQSQWIHKLAQSLSMGQPSAGGSLKPKSDKSDRSVKNDKIDRKGRSKSAPKLRRGGQSSHTRIPIAAHAAAADDTAVRVSSVGSEREDTKGGRASNRLAGRLSPRQAAVRIPRPPRAGADEAVEFEAVTVVGPTGNLQPGMVILPQSPRSSFLAQGGSIPEEAAVSEDASCSVDLSAAARDRTPVLTPPARHRGVGPTSVLVQPVMVQGHPHMVTQAWDEVCILEQVPMMSQCEQALSAATATWQPVPSAPHHFVMKCGDHLTVTCGTPPVLSAADVAQGAVLGAYGVPLCPGVQQAPTHGSIPLSSSPLPSAVLPTAEEAPVFAPAYDSATRGSDTGSVTPATSTPHRVRRANTLPGPFPAGAALSEEGAEVSAGTHRSSSLPDQVFAVLGNYIGSFQEVEDNVDPGVPSRLVATQGAMSAVHRRPAAHGQRKLPDAVVRSTRGSWLQGILEDPEAHGEIAAWREEGDGNFPLFSGPGLSMGEGAADDATWHAHKASFSEWVREGESQILRHAGMGALGPHDIAAMVAAGELPSGFEAMDVQAYFEAKQHNKSSSFSDWVYSSRR